MAEVEKPDELTGTAIVERIGWEDDREDGPAFTATLVFRNGAPNITCAVVFRQIPVRLVVVEAPKAET